MRLLITRWGSLFGCYYSCCPFHLRKLSWCFLHCRRWLCKFLSWRKSVSSWKTQITKRFSIFCRIIFCIEIHLFEQASIVETEMLGKPKRKSYSWELFRTKTWMSFLGVYATNLPCHVKYCTYDHHVTPEKVSIIPQKKRSNRRVSLPPLFSPSNLPAPPHLEGLQTHHLSCF